MLSVIAHPPACWFAALEADRRRKDGSAIYLPVSAALSIYVNVTERREVADRLKEHAERIARSNAGAEWTIAVCDNGIRFSIENHGGRRSAG